MRITLQISDELLRQANKRAADEGTNLRHIVEAALALYLARRSRPGNYQLRWGPESGRLLPDVRLDARDALFDLMDGPS